MAQYRLIERGPRYRSVVSVFCGECSDIQGKQLMKVSLVQILKAEEETARIAL